MALRNIHNGKEMSREMAEDAEKFKHLVEKRLPENVAVQLEKVILDSFEAEAYQDKTKSKWAKRKSKKDDNGRKILVKKAVLKRSIEVDVNGMEVTASTDSAYAKVHNEGEWVTKSASSFKMPRRQFMPAPGEENKMMDKSVEKWLDSEMDKIFK